MQKTFVFDEKINLNGYSVVFPSVCVGNVAQLAVDFLISTLEMKKVATVWHTAIIPILGPRAFDHKTVSDASSPSANITTACELFVSEAKRLACFQLRSPLVAGKCLTAFFGELIELLKDQQVQQIVILTGMFSHEQHAIGTTKFMYLANNQCQKECKAQLENGSWIKWDENNKIIHGGGFALKLYKQIGESVSSCIFFKYTAEGDNRNDAAEMVYHLNSLLGGILAQSSDQGGFKLVSPCSWNAMFGNDPTEQLY
ncbi:proteasome assembly chaperone 2 [Contarinia nasturtii]|uniref:proteasome assembly chaperone 2 n=1 Tax=Contarinia nasturtii TaxID=265458 RepID=UPI0012D4AFA1|nr:proteasome assembly chaperone 2 [Contarinia nasturtii]